MSRSRTGIGPSQQYKKIFEQEPKLSGIHYRLGRILLSKSPPDVDNAKAEFAEELKIDPDNASAEFMLGEIARQAGAMGRRRRAFFASVETR